MTEFTLIYDKFLSKLTDFSLARLDKDVLESDLQERLITALSDFAQLPEEKTEVDLSTKTFTNGLSVEEQNIIATLMVINYLDKYILSEDNMRILLNSKDYKQYSQAALLKELKATKSEYQSDVDAKLNSYSFRQKFRKKRKMNSKSYTFYLTELKNRVFKILPLCEEKNDYIDKYLENLIIELKGLPKAYPEVFDSQSAWYVRVLSSLFTFYEDFSIAELHSVDGVQRVRRIILSLVNLIDKEVGR